MPYFPKSQVVREAVSLYGQQLGRLNEEERKARLAAFDRVVPAIPDRPREDVERELDELRRSRRGGGRRSQGRMIVLDTSVLVEGLGAGGRMAGELRAALEAGERLVLPTLVLYEWLRGPRIPEEIEAQAALFPAGEAIPFGPDEAALATRLHRQVPRARGREIDLAIASCAISWKAPLWTLNVGDFEDLAELRLMAPPRFR